MADDLDAFFKKQSKKPKKGGVLRVDNLEKKLQNAVKRQEEMDKEEEQMQIRQKDIEANHAKVIPEDSEWHEFQDDQASLDVAKLGIKEMELTEQEDTMEQQEEEESQQNRKTWQQADENEKPVDDEQLVPVPDPVLENKEPKKSVYVPLHMRVGGGDASRHRVMGREVAPDMTNQEEFPTLANADEIAAKQEQDKKKLDSINRPQAAAIPQGGTVWGKPRDVVSQPQQSPIKPPAQEEDKFSKPSGKGYVPPHLRNKI